MVEIEGARGFAERGPLGAVMVMDLLGRSVLWSNRKRITSRNQVSARDEIHHGCESSRQEI